ncbi:MAG: DNA-binding protein [Desulfatiglandales bacterium]
MDDIEELKKKKLRELQQKLQEENLHEERAMQVEQQKKSVLMEVLTPEARSRLANVKMAKPEFAAQVESLFLQLAQSGQLKEKVTDAQLKQMLAKISGKKKDIRIRRM